MLLLSNSRKALRREVGDFSKLIPRNLAALGKRRYLVKPTTGLDRTDCLVLSWLVGCLVGIL